MCTHPDHVQADMPAMVCFSHVRMYDAREQVHFRRVCWVVLWEGQVQVDGHAGMGPLGAHHVDAPFEKIVLYGLSADVGNRVRVVLLGIVLQAPCCGEHSCVHSRLTPCVCCMHVILAFYDGLLRLLLRLGLASQIAGSAGLLLSTAMSCYATYKKKHYFMGRLYVTQLATHVDQGR